METIFANEERRRQFKIAVPGWQYLTVQELAKAWDHLDATAP